MQKQPSGPSTPKNAKSPPVVLKNRSSPSSGFFSLSPTPTTKAPESHEGVYQKMIRGTPFKFKSGTDTIEINLSYFPGGQVACDPGCITWYVSIFCLKIFALHHLFLINTSLNINFDFVGVKIQVGDRSENSF